MSSCTSLMPTAWPAKTVLKLIFFLQADAATAGDHDDPVVKRIVDVGQSLVDAFGRLIDFGRALHVQGFVRTLVVEDLYELVEPGLLLQEVFTKAVRCASAAFSIPLWPPATESRTPPAVLAQILTQDLLTFLPRITSYRQRRVLYVAPLSVRCFHRHCPLC